MATRYFIRLTDPERARGEDPDLAFRSQGAEGFAAELQEALRTPVLFERWRAKQDDPDEVDPSLGATDPAATVTGRDEHLDVWLEATTSLPGTLFKQRMRWLAGNQWSLTDVKSV
ncbi:hypothetical protein [Arenimonas composti]|uniref:Uncharacterized protein n=1 Tax=Arenimonas composti TR7-09 = DSM 18010 TaxID=1121013 RepID=A0A091BC55_9GAMM|nr:hypothetical protein [Arenimonas composti]KFN49102.1 hypothetical protein P873_12480 [Arenimonas composti TR7-09 = DSM 18010]